MQNSTLTKLSARQRTTSLARIKAVPVSKKEISPCPLDAALSIVDGRWKGTILWRLSKQPMRTSELRRSIPGITERMLIRHLQDLVRDGIIERIEESTTPARVHYQLTPYGLTLAPHLAALCAWGRIHLERIGGTGNESIT